MEDSKFWNGDEKTMSYGHWEVVVTFPVVVTLIAL